MEPGDREREAARTGKALIPTPEEEEHDAEEEHDVEEEEANVEEEICQAIEVMHLEACRTELKRWSTGLKRWRTFRKRWRSGREVVEHDLITRKRQRLEPYMV